jgi:hypothetical protein
MSKPNFKVGDWVVCLVSSKDGPKENNLYKVSVVDGNFIGFKVDFEPEYTSLTKKFIKRTKEGKVAIWLSWRFRLATPEEVNYYNYSSKLEKLIK